MDNKIWTNDSVPTAGDFARYEYIVEVGTFMWYLGLTAPAGWVQCSGQTIDVDGVLSGSDGTIRYRELGEYLERATGRRQLPSLNNVHSFVCFDSTKAVGAYVPAYNNILTEHKHNVYYEHKHRLASHTHSMEHRHEMYPMDVDGDQYDAYPHNTTNNNGKGRSIAKGRKFKRSGNYKDRRYAYSEISDTKFTDSAAIYFGSGSIIDDAHTSNESADNNIYPNYIPMLPIIKA